MSILYPPPLWKPESSSFAILFSVRKNFTRQRFLSVHGLLLIYFSLISYNPLISQCWEGLNHLNYAADLKQVNSISRNSVGELWFATENGVARLDTLFHLQEFIQTPQGRMLGQVRDIAIDSNDKLWIATNSGLFTKTDEEWEYFGPDNSPMNSGDLTSIITASSGVVWIGTAANGIMIYNCGKWEIKDKLNSDLPSNQIRDIEKQGIGSYWIATDSGVAKFDGESWEVYNPDNSGLQDWKVNKIQFATLTGAVYCGTEAHGINVFNGSWSYINTGNSDLPSNKVLALYIYDDGENTTILIGTEGGYVMMNTAVEMTVFTISNSPMKSNIVRSVFGVGATRLVTSQGDDVYKVSMMNLQLRPKVNYFFRKNKKCEGNEIQLYAGTEWDSVLWSNDVTTMQNSVTTPGEYSFIAYDPYGCQWHSDTVVISDYTLSGINIVSNIGFEFECGDTAILKTEEEFSDFTWLYSSTGQVLSNADSCLAANSGEYILFAYDSVGCYYSDTISILLTPIDSIELIATSLMPDCGDSVSIYINETPDFWYWMAGANVLSDNDTLKVGSTTHGITGWFWFGQCKASSDSIAIIYKATDAIPVTFLPSEFNGLLCQGDSVKFTVSESYANIKWYNYGMKVHEGNEYYVKEAGSYVGVGLNPVGCQAYTDTISVETLTPFPEQICTVTIQEEDQKVKIRWNKTPDQRTDYYYLYRQADSLGKYELIYYTTYSSTPEYVDPIPDPGLHAYNYRLVTRDSCGAFLEGELVADFSSLFLTVSENKGLVNLLWLPSSAFPAIQYVVYKGTDPDEMYPIYELPPNVFMLTDSLLNDSIVYYYVEGRGYDTCTADSEPRKILSNRVSWFSSCCNVCTAPLNFEDELDISWLNPDSLSYTVRLIDSKGDIALTESGLEGETAEIDTSEIEKGPYILELVNGTSICRKRVYKM